MILFHQVDPDFEEECLEFQPSVSMGESLLIFTWQGEAQGPAAASQKLPLSSPRAGEGEPSAACKEGLGCFS